MHVSHITSLTAPIQAAVTALYEQVRAYVKRSFGAVTRSTAWKALPVAKQPEIMKGLQV
jgi:hypothetical protein